MGAASGGLGGDVADSKARCAAGEQPVGDQRTLGAKTGTLEERRGIQHLLHARATGGALVSNHQHLARLDDALENGLDRVLLALDHPGGAGEAEQ